MAPDTPRHPVRFTEADVKAYLDSCIRYWRERRDEHEQETKEWWIAASNIDAFQSVRMSLFNELLRREP